MADTKLTREWVEEELLYLSEMPGDEYELRRALCRHYLATEQMAAALRVVMREADAAKEPCGSDPESAAAIRNGKFATIAAIAAQGLGLVRGPDLATEQDALGPIERNDDYEREYIPLPDGWEVHTKGLGSSFRIANTKNGERLNIPDSPYLHETLEQMARDIHAALTQKETPK